MFFPGQLTRFGVTQTVALGQKMDLVFSLMRLHFMFGDFVSIKADIRKVRQSTAGCAAWLVRLCVPGSRADAFSFGCKTERS